jgi:uncharacterized protein
MYASPSIHAWIGLWFFLSSSCGFAQARAGLVQDRPGRAVTQSLEDLKKAAEAGDTVAMTELGERYLQDIKPNHPEALRWFRQAIEKGNARAMERLGGMYRDGHGVKQDYQLAMSWYRKAMDGGDLTAIASIGWLHYNGLGVRATRKLSHGIERRRRRMAMKG